MIIRLRIGLRGNIPLCYGRLVTWLIILLRCIEMDDVIRGRGIIDLIFYFHVFM